MLQRLTGAALLAWLFIFSAHAGAEPTAAPKPATPAKQSVPPEIRHDPLGIKGISPFREALGRGDGALLGGDFEGALSAYRDALSQEPGNALGQYRLGEAQLLKGDLQEAERAFSAGLSLVAATNLGLKAKLQFALADLRERQKAYDEASAKWTEYELYTTAEQQAQGFPASGTERKKVLETWKKLSADSAAVKARVEKGVQAADEAVRKSSK